MLSLSRYRGLLGEHPVPVLLLRPRPSPSSSLLGAVTTSGEQPSVCFLFFGFFIFTVCSL